MIAPPSVPYYAVIFTSVIKDDTESYHEMAEKMLALAEKQDGYLGIESARNDIGITASYWRDLDSIKKWREHVEHRIARQKGRDEWYQTFKTRIAKVERDYDFSTL